MDTKRHVRRGIVSVNTRMVWPVQQSERTIVKKVVKLMERWLPDAAK